MLFSLEELTNRLQVKKGADFSGIALDEAVDSSIANFSAFSADVEYDIFLSHSSLDKNQVAMLADVISEFGFSVYLDWRADPQLDRANVTRDTAATLRRRMKNCRCLLYAQSINALQSRWMPWETGFMDGLKDRVAIVPLVQKTIDGEDDNFSGQEYLSLYPYISKANIKGTNSNILWVNDSVDIYCKFEDWLSGKNPYKHNKGA